MRRLKKAFTLVELVVVIAVIAILSGIAVTAYSGVTTKAKWAADTALVDQWNTLLKVDEIEHEMQDVIEVKEYILDNGFSEDDFTPRSRDYGFYYCDENNRTYICYDAEGLDNLKVEYPEKDGVASRYNTYNLSKEYIRIETPSGSSVIESSDESSSSEESIISSEESSNSVIVESSAELTGGYTIAFNDSGTYNFSPVRYVQTFSLYFYNKVTDETPINTVTYIYDSSKYPYYSCDTEAGTLFTHIEKIYCDCPEDGLAVKLANTDTSAALATWEPKNGAYTVTCNTTITDVVDSQCIDENSLITMADGTTKAMKDIRVGDDVLSIDFNTMKLVSRKVIYSAATDDENYDSWTVNAYYKHTFSDGTVINRAMRHRFYCLETQSYKHMDTWSVGLHGYKEDGTNPELVSTEVVQGTIHYGRITLEGSNNFFANGLSTGDSECCPNPVTLNSLLCGL